MKLTSSQSDLSAALSLVSRAVAGRPTHPVLANVLLTADAATGRLSLTGFDLSLGIQTSIAASVGVSGATTVPARLFGEIIGRLPSGDPITLVSSDQLEISSLSGSYRIQQLPAEDYPDLPVSKSGKAVSLQAADIARGLKATLFASSNDESKQLLTGVHMTGSEFAATDGHRLAVLSTSAETIEPITVPSRALRELERLLGSGIVEMFSDRGQVVFTCGDHILTSRSLDGTYPNYQALIPASFNRAIALDRRAFIAALERVAVLADQGNNVVKLSVDPDRSELKISADAQEVGSGSEILSAEITGEAIAIAFNVRYLIDGLRAINAETVSLLANSPTAPAVLRAADTEYTYLVMPVQVKS